MKRNWNGNVERMLEQHYINNKKKTNLSKNAN
jgi:hypothetical protein